MKFVLVTVSGRNPCDYEIKSVPIVPVDEPNRIENEWETPKEAMLIAKVRRGYNIETKEYKLVVDGCKTIETWTSVYYYVDIDTIEQFMDIMDDINNSKKGKEIGGCALEIEKLENKDYAQLFIVDDQWC